MPHRPQCRSAPGARRRRRAKSPPAPSAAVLEAPPRLLTQSGPLQLGAKAELQVQIAEERLLAEQEQRQRAEHGSAAPAERSTAARPVYPPTQSVSHIVPAPPKLGAATQQAEEKQQEQPATPQQHKREQPASPRGGGGPAARRQKPRSRRSGNTSRKSSRATIRPKEGDLVGWYQDATKAAEQAHRAAARGGGAAPSLAHALVKPLQVGRRAGGSGRAAHPSQPVCYLLCSQHHAWPASLCAALASDTPTSNQPTLPTTNPPTTPPACFSCPPTTGPAG